MAVRLQAGDRFGDLRLVQKVPDDLKTKSPNLKRRWRVECSCGNRLTIPEYYLTRKQPAPKRHCGCKNKTLKTEYKREHGIWWMMHVRCYDPRHEAYKHYGGRGIHVCPEWHKDNPDGKGFERFFSFMGPAPSKSHSIDRVDNDGSYYPFQADGVTRQVRWATAKEQRANQRKPGGKS
jgi:hypothetical protein